MVDVTYTFTDPKDQNNMTDYIKHNYSCEKIKLQQPFVPSNGKRCEQTFK